MTCLSQIPGDQKFYCLSKNKLVSILTVVTLNKLAKHVVKFAKTGKTTVYTLNTGNCLFQDKFNGVFLLRYCDFKVCLNLYYLKPLYPGIVCNIRKSLT